MKKVLLVLLGMFLVVVVVAAAVYMALEPLAQKGIQHFGSRTLRTPVQVQEVQISLFPGQVLLRGLEIGDPYGNPGLYAALVPSLRLRLQLGSLLEPKLVIDELVISGPAFVLGPGGQERSVEAWQSGLERITGRLESGLRRLPARLRLQINHLLLDRAKLVLREGPGGAKRSLDLAKLEMKGLGKDGPGLSPAQVVEVLRRYLAAQVQAAAKR
ncbi:MAG: AsmA family protein [Thermodesulfobacteriota bacterium]